MLLCGTSCDMWRGTWSGTWSDMHLLQGSADRTVPAIQTSIVTSVTLVTCWYNYTFISDIQVRSRVVTYLQARQSMSDPRTVVRCLDGSQRGRNINPGNQALSLDVAHRRLNQSSYRNHFLSCHASGQSWRQLQFVLSRGSDAADRRGEGPGYEPRR